MLLGDLIKENVAGAEMKWALFAAAVRSYKADTLVKPFPPMFISDSDGDKDFERLEKAVVSLPCSIKQLRSLDSFDQLTEDQQQLIDWLLRSADYDLKQLTNDEVAQVSALCRSQTEAPSPSIIFRVNYSDRVERRFTDVRGDRDTLFAFHGSALHNFTSILRHGLINNMNKISAFGEGTYLSTELSLSLNWSPMSAVDRAGKRVGCVALCEIVNDPSGVKIGCNESAIAGAQTIPNKYFIVRNDELVIVRYLLVYEQESKPQQTCQQQRFLRRAVGWLSAHQFWLLMCLYFGLLLAVGLASSSNFRFYWKRLFAQYWPNCRHNDHRHYEEA